MDQKTLDLSNFELYINRELSQLEFNRRVVEQAKDPSNPLLERLKFLCIASSNLDEFFEIRVAGLRQQVAYRSESTGPDKLTASEQLKQISEVAHELVAEQYRVLNEVLTPLLAEEEIHFLRRGQWSNKQAGWVKRFFNRELMPVLSPIGLDPSHPFPRVLNKSLNFLVSLEGKDAFGRDSAIAIVQAPRALPRIINVPETYANGPHEFVFLSSLIHAHVDDIFPGMRVTGCYQFRVTRDSDLFVDDEEVEDLLRALEGELQQQRFGDAVRLEVADDCPLEMISLLQHEFNLTDDAIFMCKGPVNLARLMAVPNMITRPDLKFPAFTPSRPRRLAMTPDMFSVIRRGDIMLHHPFESFLPVIEFLRQAASDPGVLVIKQTLYRTGPDSPVAKALIDAARAGKEVTVVVELHIRRSQAEQVQRAFDMGLFFGERLGRRALPLSLDRRQFFIGQVFRIQDASDPFVVRRVLRTLDGFGVVVHGVGRQPRQTETAGFQQVKRVSGEAVAPAGTPAIDAILENFEFAGLVVDVEVLARHPSASGQERWLLGCARRVPVERQVPVLQRPGSTHHLDCVGWSDLAVK